MNFLLVLLRMLIELMPKEIILIGSTSYLFLNLFKYFQYQEPHSNFSLSIFFITIVVYVFKKQIINVIDWSINSTATNAAYLATSEMNSKPRNFKYNFELENLLQLKPTVHSFPEAVNAKNSNTNQYEKEKETIHNLDSDWSCNRRSKCLNDIELISKQHEILRIVKVYFMTGRAQNPSLLPVTFKLLSKCTPQQRDWHLSWLLSVYPLNFTVKQLRAIRRQINSYLDLTNQSPLLIVYLAKQYDKYKFYKKMGYSDQVIYKACIVSYTNSELTEVIFADQKLKPNQHFLGMTLAEVADFERPQTFIQKNKLAH